MEVKREVLVALAITVFGVILMYVSSRFLNPSDPSQALVAYVGVFVVAVGILLVASLLLLPSRQE